MKYKGSFAETQLIFQGWNLSLEFVCQHLVTSATRGLDWSLQALLQDTYQGQPGTSFGYWMSWLTLKAWNNSCHFENDILNCLFLNENYCTSVQFPTKFVLRNCCPTDNHLALIQMMAWHRTGNNPLPKPVQCSTLYKRNSPRLRLETDHRVRHYLSRR